MKKSKDKLADVVHPRTKKKWLYSQKVKDHFFHPKNLLLKEPKKGEFNGLGLAGSLACGDMMKVWIKVDKNERIKKMKWRTFGCASAIAATSMLSLMVTEKGGMKIEKALKIKPQDIIKRLGGLPAIKIHCSFLGRKALEEAIWDYFKKSGQEKRIPKQKSKVIDKVLNITEKEIERAVKEGAKTLEEVQAKTKVGLGDPSSLKKVEKLIRFYVSKYQ